MEDATARVLPEEGPVCLHRRRTDHEVKTVRGAPDGSTPMGFHLAQGGVCLDCGCPTLRISPHVLLGSPRAAGLPDAPVTRQQFRDADPRYRGRRR